jgi:pimeloyl-ACP methyl ester carboxylesterase
MPSLPPAIHLAYTERGEGPLVVALHDLGRSGATMMAALKPLLRDGYHVVAPDLRGHGSSPTPPGPWSIDDLASDVSRLAMQEGGGAIAVGVGLGAATALAVALGHPGTVSGLVLSGLGSRAEDPEGRERWGRVARALRQRGGTEGVALATEAMSTRPDWRGALAQVDVPVEIVAGAADRAVPAQSQRELSVWIRGARFETVPDAGHDLVAERPGELIEAVRRLSSDLRQPVAA